MQEMIEQIVKAAYDSCGYGMTLNLPMLQSKLLDLLPPATIHPSQFFNGEPEEDGEYVCRTGHSTYAIVEYKNVSATSHSPAWSIISHCKLP